MMRPFRCDLILHANSNENPIAWNRVEVEARSQPPLKIRKSGKLSRSRSKVNSELVSLALGPKQLQCTDILDPTLPDLSQYKKVNGSLLVASINITSGQGDRGVSWGRVTIGAELTIYKCGRARWKLE